MILVTGAAGLSGSIIIAEADRKNTFVSLTQKHKGRPIAGRPFLRPFLNLTAIARFLPASLWGL